MWQKNRWSMQVLKKTDRYQSCLLKESSCTLQITHFGRRGTSLGFYFYNQHKIMKDAYEQLSLTMSSAKTVPVSLNSLKQEHKLDLKTYFWPTFSLGKKTSEENEGWTFYFSLRKKQTICPMHATSDQKWTEREGKRHIPFHALRLGIPPEIIFVSF